LKDRAEFKFGQMNYIYSSLASLSLAIVIDDFI